MLLWVTIHTHSPEISYPSTLHRADQISRGLLGDVQFGHGGGKGSCCIALVSIWPIGMDSALSEDIGCW